MKNKLSIRVLSLLIAAITVFSLSGCSTSRPIESTEDDLRVVGTVGEFEVLYEELRFVVVTY